MKVVFFGTPDFAVPTLEALASTEDLKPALVVSQPSRPVGRRREPQPPPVVRSARDLGLPVEQVASVRDRDFLATLDALAPDVAVVVAFGQIFRRRLLALPRLGCVNLHASLLPAYRGAAPIQAAIAAGDRITGVTTMQMARGLDSGPMLLRGELQIGRDETTPELSPRLAALGADLMVETLRRLDDGLESTPQDDALATFAPRLERTDAEIEWRLEARQIYDRWRAFQPWPGLASSLADRPLKILAGKPLPGSTDTAEGTFLGLTAGAMEVACGGGTIFGVERVQRPGKKPVTAADFVNGERPEIGERLGHADVDTP